MAESTVQELKRQESGIDDDAEMDEPRTSKPNGGKTHVTFKGMPRCGDNPKQRWKRAKVLTLRVILKRRLQRAKKALRSRNTKRMATSVACKILYNLLLPLSLLAACIFRYNFFSFLYFTCFLVLPLLPSPSKESMKGHTGRFLKTILIISSIIVGIQLVFQIVLLALQPYGHWLEFCSTTEKVLRQIGLQRLDIPAVDAVRAVAPDCLMFVVSIIVYVVCYKLTKNDNSRDATNTVVQRRTKQKSLVVDLLWSFSSCFLTALAGIILPSVTSSVYFVTFLVVVTWWCFYKNWGRKLVYVRIVMLTYCGAHLVALYLYQFQFFQSTLHPKSLYARLFGLTAIVIYDCDTPYQLQLDTELDWPVYVNPVVLLIYYWYLALLTCQWIQNPHMLEVTHSRTKKRRRNNSGEKEQNPKLKLLVDESRRGKTTSYQSLDPVAGSRPDSPLEEPTTRSTSLLPSGSETASPGTPGSEHPIEEDLNRPRVRKAWMSVLFFIMKQSYTVSLIVMMAWSITYHSWLTFVLLLWACFIWMIPNSRAACLYSSPFLVFYAECLLIIGYVYGLNLTDDELPTEGSTNYRDIGLVKHQFPCVHLAVKILYTSVFWLTLRQYSRERLLKKRQMSETIGLQPFGLIFQTENVPAAPDLEAPGDFHDGEDSDKMKKFGKTIQDFLSKYWIVLCGAMFLIVSLQEDVVLYRIIYMALFLFYMIILVISYKVWRLIMLPYWWIVVFYSMCILVIIYTYQFENFPQYWQNGTGLSESTLSDIGLQQYGTSGLLVGLLTPTVFVIIIVVQLHYYHTSFLAISAIGDTMFYRKARGREEKEDVTEEDRGIPEGGVDEPDKASQDTLAHKTPKEYFIAFCKAVKYWYRQVTLILWRLLEIHMIKIIFFSITAVCITEVSALNFIYIFFMFFAIPIPWLQGAFCICAMCWTSLIILAKMSFQLTLVNATAFDVDCDSAGIGHIPIALENGTFNLAEWVGFEKTDRIAKYTLGYIAICLVIIIQAIVNLHQKQYRWENNIETPKRGILFNEITRENADEGLLEMTKFLINYFFYKFGLEVCYAMTVITICVRLDVYGVIYATWLGILMLLLRRITYLVWPVYMCFLSILFPILYLVCLGLPEGLCIAYPWSSYFNPNLIRWLYLPDYINQPQSSKLMADFFQLLFVCLQWQVFRVESKIQEQYGGGDNDMIDKEGPIEDNPVPNFVFNKTYLDLLKNAFFNYTLWVVLAMVFLAGTSLVSIFCLGYLGLCFFFMWFGQDYLLKPRQTLLKAWNVLMMYNVAVIFIKACLQVVACVYIQSFYKKFCWLIQLLSLVCLQGDMYETGANDSDCQAPVDQAGMSWDGVLFVFLLVQKRIFTCHYFQYIVEEVKEENTLAARGATIINEQLASDVRDRKDREEETLHKIRKKIEKVKARQDKLRGKDKCEPRDHWEEARQYFMGSRKRGTVRGGDRYLWQDESSDEESEDTRSEEEEPRTPRKAGPMQLAYTAITEGTKETIKKDRAIKRSMSQSDPVEKGRRQTIATLPSEGQVFVGEYTHDSSSAPVSPSSPTSPKSLPTPPMSPTIDDKDTVDGATASKPKTETDIDAVCPEEGQEEEEGTRPEEPEKKKEDTLWDKFCNTITVGWLIYLRFVDAVIEWLFTISANYRHVANQLKRYRAEMRQKKDNQQDQDDQSGVIQLSVEDETAARQPSTSDKDDAASAELTIVPLKSEDDEERKPEDDSKSRSQEGLSVPSSVPIVRTGDIVPKKEQKLRIIPPVHPPHSSEEFEYVGDDITDDMTGDKSERRKMSRPVRLLFALLYVLISQSQLVCYFLMILSQIVEASLLSLPYPISVFLWAMLTVPRPTKRYWICAISYTEIVVLVKFFFQFGFWPWATLDTDIEQLEDPFWWPRVIGIDRRDNYAVYDLAILLALFFHRSVLKSHGLWKDGSREDESEKTKPGADVDTGSASGEIEDTSRDAAASIGESEGKDLAITETDGQGLSIQKGEYDTVAQREEDAVTMTDEEVDEVIQQSWLGALFKPFKEFYYQMTDTHIQCCY
ncbi:piezo-type mechanosensitive ion channel component 2-like isoform X5 [Ptychodera flava]|uniref:piezo-type mechanosensitive ion channel component 2-like isoform X5 n=1 Tax=Ptychodera flava TaxID=63121 RepID=UPI00396A1F69